MVGESGAARYDPKKTYRIAIITSSNVDPYQSAIVGFQSYLHDRGLKIHYSILTLQANEPTATEEIKRLLADKHDLIFTLGSLATQKTTSVTTRTPIVAGMVLTRDLIADSENATGVLLEFPLEEQLDWLNRILPGRKTVGVLYNPGQNRKRISIAHGEFRKTSSRLFAHPVDNPKRLPEALDKLSKKVDVIWGLSDKVVLTPHTAKPILLFSLRNRIPFIGLSRSWVKAGALYALDRDYVDIGQQCSELALSIMKGTRVTSLPLQTPRKLYYVLNLRTAKHMKLKLSPDIVNGATHVYR